MQNVKNDDFIFEQVEQNEQNNINDDNNQKNNQQSYYQQMILLEQSQIDSMQIASQNKNYQINISKPDSINKNNTLKITKIQKIDQSNVEQYKTILQQKSVEKYSHKRLKKQQKNQSSTNNQNQEYNRTQDFLKQQQRIQLQKSSIQKQKQKQNIRKLPKITKDIKFQDVNPNSSNIQNNETSYITLKKQDESSNKLQSNNDSLMKLPQQNSINIKLSLKAVPKQKNLKCVLKRQKKCCINYYHPQFVLQLKETTFLINAKKEFGNINSRYNITSSQGQFNKKSESLMGYLTANFIGSQFNLFSLSSDGQSQLICTIEYFKEWKCLMPFIRMQIYIKNQDYSYNELYGYSRRQFKNLRQLYPIGDNLFGKRIQKLITKVPTYNHKTDSYSLKFNKKNILSSTKNMILVSQNDVNKNILLFCKTDKNNFCMQISNPLSPLISMGIILSCFDFKIYCQ